MKTAIIKTPNIVYCLYLYCYRCGCIDVWKNNTRTHLSSASELKPSQDEPINPGLIARNYDSVTIIAQIMGRSELAYHGLMFRLGT